MLNFLLSRFLLPLSVAISLLGFMVATHYEASTEMAVLVSSILTLVTAIALERRLPFKKQWNTSHADVATDITSASILIGLTDPLLKYSAPVFLVMLCAYIPASLQLDLVPNSMPFAIELIIATLLIELGRYWAHRLHHKNPYLWWLHAMHHSSERLYSLNNFRFHPLNYFINFCISILPAMLLGFDADVLLGYLAITQPVLMLQHANINLRSGWFNYIFSSNELHRWHHSSHYDEANHNFSNAFIIWDLVFGTFKYDALQNAPKHIGLFSASSKYPSKSSYFQQLFSMFKPGCCAH
jgi:ornithine lipid hydroxylase